MAARISSIIGTLLVLAACNVSIARRVNLRDFSWKRPQLPNISTVTEIEEGRAEFQGHVRRVMRLDCDLDCQIRKDKRPLSMEDIENDMSYETLDLHRQVRIKTVMNVTDVPDEVLRYNKNSTSIRTTFVEGQETTGELIRRKRAVFGYDTRFSLSSQKFSTMFPFSTAVKLSTGCAGVLVSPKHVLTSAHCIHNGKRYLKGVKRLRVGRVMKKTPKKQNKKVNKKLSKKGSKKGNKKGKKLRKRKKGKKAKKVRVTRTRRSASVTQKFKWTRARKTHIPQSWLSKKGKKGANLMVEYDYAVLELRRPLGTDFMKIGISPEKEHLSPNQRIHFTAFDQGKKPGLVYRNCVVDEQSMDMMYHYCDAERGSSGAGIYVRLYDRDTSEWDRRIIGVFSGHQWVDMGEDESPKEYNTGVRITPLKYAQICFWTTGDYSQCRSG